MKAKKLLAMILSLTMILGLCTVGAKAAETTVSTEAELSTALAAAASGDTIKLGDNITLVDRIWLPSGVTLDGDGHTLSFDPATKYNMSIVNISSGLANEVTLKNITINGRYSWKCITADSNLVLEDVTLINYSKDAVAAQDNTVTVKGTLNVTLNDETEDIANKNTNWQFFSFNKAGGTLDFSNATAVNITDNRAPAGVNQALILNYFGGTIIDAEKFGFTKVGGDYKVAIGTSDVLKGYDLKTAAYFNTLYPYECDGVYYSRAPIAKNGSQIYDSLQSAIDAAAAGDTVTLLRDVVVPFNRTFVNEGAIHIEKSLTLDGAGHTISTDNDNWEMNDAANSGHVIDVSQKYDGTGFTGDSVNVTIKNLVIDAHAGTKHAINTVGIEESVTPTVTVQDVTVNSCGTISLQANKSNVTVKGETTLADGGWGHAINVDKTATLTIEDAKVTTGVIKADDSVTTGGNTVTISAGFFGGVVSTSEANTVTISGGIYKTAPDKSFLAEGKALYPVEGKGVEVKDKPAEAAADFSLAPTETTVTTKTVYDGKVIEVEFDEDAVEAIRTAADDASASTVTFVVDNASEVVTPPTGETEALVFDMHLEDQDENIVPYSGGEAEVRIPFTGDANKIYTVYYKESDGSLTNMNARYVDGYLVFRTSHFSTYLVTAIDGVPAETFKIGLTPLKDGDIENCDVYGIVLYPTTGNYINRFTAAHMTFELTQGLGHINYEITSNTGAHIQLNDSLSASGVYQFYVHESYGPTAEETWSDVSGRTIQIGTVKFSGYGQNAKFKITDATVNTTTLTDNIVVSSLSSGDLEMVNTTPTAKNDETALIQPITLNPVTKNLTINVTFPNAVSNQTFAYQDMKLTVSGGDLTNDIVVKLGSDTKATHNTATETNGVISVNANVYPYAGSAATTVTWNDPAAYVFDLKTSHTANTLNDVPSYQVVLTDILTENVLYKVEITGAGYRTARYNVLMNSNKTLTFWNNAMDGETVIEKTNTTFNDDTAVKVTYLAGDIVKDAQINIYDLSAVVSYFGTVNTTTAASDYAKYDLNRDGKIDSIDVAYVLVSWGK